MRTILRIGILALAATIGAAVGTRWESLHWRAEALAPSPQEVETALNEGRFQLVHIRYQPHGADGTAMIDTRTGRVWELANSKDQGTILQELPRSPQPASTK